MGIVSGIVSLVQGDMAAQAISDAANAEARVELDEAAIKALELRRKAAITNGLDALSFRKGHTRTSSGTPLEVLGQNASEREQEALDRLLYGKNAAAFARARGEAAKTAFQNQAIAMSFDFFGGTAPQQIVAGRGQTTTTPGTAPAPAASIATSAITSRFSGGAGSSLLSGKND